MERSHATSIDTHFSAHLSQDEARVISTVFGRIAAADDPAPTLNDTAPNRCSVTPACRS